MTGPGASATTEVAFTRLLHAPRDLVFRMWVEPESMAQWWGPKGFTNPACELDARPGGAIRIVMRGPDGTDHSMKGVFRDVRAPERLVFTAIPVDEAGNELLEALTAVTFGEAGGGTKLTVRASGVARVARASRMLDGMEEGWSQSLDRLEALVARAKG